MQEVKDLCSAGGTRIELGLLGEPNPCSALDAGHIWEVNKWLSTRRWSSGAKEKTCCPAALCYPSKLDQTGLQICIPVF